MLAIIVLCVYYAATQMHSGVLNSSLDRERLLAEVFPSGGHSCFKYLKAPKF